MNWDAIGAVGQTLGAVAVFISLGYLAVQIKVSGLTAKHAAQSAFVADYNRMLEHIYTSPELVGLMGRAIPGLAALDKSEQERFHCLMSASLLLTLNMYIQVEAKQFDSRIARPLIGYFASVCKTKGGNDWWAIQRRGYDGGFGNHIDSLVNDPGTPVLDELQPWWKRD